MKRNLIKQCKKLEQLHMDASIFQDAFVQLNWNRSELWKTNENQLLSAQCSNHPSSRYFRMACFCSLKIPEMHLGPLLCCKGIGTVPDVSAQKENAYVDIEQTKNPQIKLD